MATVFCTINHLYRMFRFNGNCSTHTVFKFGVVWHREVMTPSLIISSEVLWVCLRKQNSRNMVQAVWEFSSPKWNWECEVNYLTSWNYVNTIRQRESDWGANALAAQSAAKASLIPWSWELAVWLRGCNNMCKRRKIVRMIDECRLDILAMMTRKSISGHTPRHWGSCLACWRKKHLQVKSITWVTVIQFTDDVTVQLYKRFSSDSTTVISSKESDSIHYHKKSCWRNCKGCKETLSLW